MKLVDTPNKNFNELVAQVDKPISEQAKEIVSYKWSKEVINHTMLSIDQEILQSTELNKHKNSIDVENKDAFEKIAGDKAIEVTDLELKDMYPIPDFLIPNKNETTELQSQSTKANLKSQSTDDDQRLERISETTEPLSLNKKGLHTMTQNQLAFEKLDFNIPTISATNKEAPNHNVRSKGRIDLPKWQFFFIFTGISLSVFLASLDLTIISTALPKIGSQLHSIGDITWIPTSYLLTSTVVLPIQGKLTDVFGRKPTILTSICIFLIGSLGCALSPNMLPLIIAFRAIAGIGGGGLPSLAIIIIADLISLQKRPKYMGIISAVFGISSIIGPLIGGLLVDNVGWRSLFWVNIPIGALALAFITWFLPSSLALKDQAVPEEKKEVVCVKRVDDHGITLDAEAEEPPLKKNRKQMLKKKLKRIDFLGATILVSSNLSLLLALNWAGQDYPWSHPIIYSLLILSVLLFMIFILIEWKIAKEPVISYRLFNRNTSLALLCSFCLGYLMYNTTYHLPMFYQIVKSDSATLSGLKLIPNLFSFVFWSIFSGVLSSVLGQYLPFIYIGALMATIGVGLLSTLTLQSPYSIEIIYIIITGSGLGLTLQNLILISHANVEIDGMATMTTLVTFSRQIGGIFGLAIGGTTLNNVIQHKLRVSGSVVEYYQLMELVASINTLRIKDSLAIKLSYVDGFRILWLSMLPIALIWFFISFFIKHKSLITKTTSVE